MVRRFQPWGPLGPSRAGSVKARNRSALPLTATGHVIQMPDGNEDQNTFTSMDVNNDHAAVMFIVLRC